MHRIIAWNIERWSPLRREAGTGAERPIILNWNKSRSRKLASQIVNVAAVLRRSVLCAASVRCKSWLLFGWTDENNVMTISCNNLILFLSVVCVLSWAGEGRQCISSHNISNGTIQCSLYNLGSGSESLSAGGVSSDSDTVAPRPRLRLRLCVSVSESPLLLLSVSWSPARPESTLRLRPLVTPAAWHL